MGSSGIHLDLPAPARLVTQEMKRKVGSTLGGAKIAPGHGRLRETGLSAGILGHFLRLFSRARLNQWMQLQAHPGAQALLPSQGSSLGLSGTPGRRKDLPVGDSHPEALPSGNLSCMTLAGSRRQRKG